MALPNATVNFLWVRHYFESPNRKPMSISTYWSESPATAALATQADIVAIANAMHGNFGSLWIELADSNCYITNTRATWYGAGDDGWWDGWSSSAALNGERIGADAYTDIGESESLPDFAALLFSIRTDSRVKSKRGCRYIPGISETVQKNGFLQEEAYTDANALAAFIGGDQVIAGTTFHPRHWDRKNNLLVPIRQVYVMERLTHIDSRKSTSLNLPTP